MPNKEKVIEGLICCQYSSKSHCDGCPYCYEGLCETNDCTADLASDALTLLKEPEAIKPTKANNPDESEYCCGICGYPLWLDEFYCAHCGRRIWWESR